MLLEGRLVESAGLRDGILRGERRSLEQLDDLALGQIITGSTVRTKLWTRDGRILYSDEPSLIGQRFALGRDEREPLDSGGANAELSDLSKPENRFERQEGKLLEAHTVIRTPNRTPVLFETYQRFSSISADGSRLLSALAPPLLAGLAVLLAIPGAARLRDGAAAAARSRRAGDASAIGDRRLRRRAPSHRSRPTRRCRAGRSRRRLRPCPTRRRRRAQRDRARAATLRDAIATLRQGVRDLRTLLVEIHPPSLESAGLEGALADLLGPLGADGSRTSLEVDPAARSGSVHDALVYRVAREALRNTAAHAQASSVNVVVDFTDARRLRLRVTDDGRGYSPGQRAAREADNHLGLQLLEGLVRESGGTLKVHSQPGEGTTVTLEVGE